MKRQLQSKVVSKALGMASAALVLLLSTGQVFAFDVGHSRVTSAPGQPLVADVALTNLSEGDIQTLKVEVAPAARWAEVGLVPPVALDSLRLVVVPGATASSRVIRVSSTTPYERSVVDMVLSVSTGSASRLVQTSVIVPAPLVIRTAGGQTITVMRGDTLIGIANRFPVQGADLYQMLWALYQANPRAFISENMHLLRAGAALSIPDAATVRALDPRLAKARYLAHLQSFRNMRGGAGAVPAPVSIAPTAPPPAPQQGKVEPEPVTPIPVPVEDKVTLSSAAVDVSKDQQVSATRATAEERSRVDQLAQNVEALRSAAAVAAARASGGTGAAGSATGSAASTAPGTVAGSPAGTVAATAPSAAPSAAPGTGSSTAPGTVEATAPSAAPSAAPGTGSSTAPGTAPSAASGTGSSAAPGTAAATASSAAPSAASGTVSSTAAGTGSSTAAGTAAGVGSSTVASSSPSSGAAAGSAIGSTAGAGSSVAAGSAAATAAGTAAAVGSSAAAGSAIAAPGAGSSAATGSAAGAAAGTGSSTAAGSAPGTVAGPGSSAAAVTAAGTAPSSAPGTVAGSAAGALAGAALSSGSGSTSSSVDGGSRSGGGSPGSSMSAPSVASSPAVTNQVELDAVGKAKRWVVDNVVASIAIVLALLALILAWALRSPAERSESKVEQEPVTDSPQALAFKEKLQGIDLSLDAEPATVEPTSTEPAKQPDSKV